MANLRQLIKCILICMLLPQVLFVGCTIIGAVIGATHSYDDRVNLSVLTSGAVQQGTYIVVTKKDFSTIKGKFLGLTAEDEVSYTERYLAAAHNLEDIGVLPLPGDSLVFPYAVPGGVFLGRGRFRAVDPGTLVVVGMRSRGGTEARFDLDSLSSLHVEGKGDVNLAWFRSLISPRYLPTVTTQLALRNDADTTVFVPMEEIGTVEIDRAHTGWLAGLGIGFAVDLAVIAAVASGGGSCSKGCGDNDFKGCSTPTAK